MTAHRKCQTPGCNNPVEFKKTCGLCNSKLYESERQQREWDRESNWPPISGLVALGVMIVLVVLLLIAIFNLAGG